MSELEITKTGMYCQSIAFMNVCTNSGYWIKSKNKNLSHPEAICFNHYVLWLRSKCLYKDLCKKDECFDNCNKNGKLNICDLWEKNEIVRRNRIFKESA